MSILETYFYTSTVSSKLISSQTIFPPVSSVIFFKLPDEISCYWLPMSSLSSLL